MKYIVTVETPRTETYRGYECAAWWKEMQAVPGEYELTLRQNPNDFKLLPMYATKIAATIIKDSFQSLWCGNRIGEPYNQLQNAGKPDAFDFSSDSLSLMQNPRVVMSEEEYDTLLDQAIAYAVFHEGHQRKRVAELIAAPLYTEDRMFNKHGDYVMHPNAVDTWQKTLLLLHELTGNRCHRAERREREAKGLYNDPKPPRIKQNEMKEDR